MQQPREVFTYGPGVHEFRLADYPWLKALAMHVRGGTGGAAADGTPGKPGEVAFRRMSAAELPPVLTITVIAGGAPQPGGQPGEPGLVVLELYDD